MDQWIRYSVASTREQTRYLTGETKRCVTYLVVELSGNAEAPLGLQGKAWTPCSAVVRYINLRSGR